MFFKKQLIFGKSVKGDRWRWQTSTKPCKSIISVAKYEELDAGTQLGQARNAEGIRVRISDILFEEFWAKCLNSPRLNGKYFNEGCFLAFTKGLILLFEKSILSKIKNYLIMNLARHGVTICITVDPVYTVTFVWVRILYATVGTYFGTYLI